MNRYPIVPGAIVVSKMGRDQGRSFVVVQEVDPDFVMLADGRLRTMDRLKKKRRKHLKTTGIVVQEMCERFENHQAIEDHEVRSWLKREEM